MRYLMILTIMLASVSQQAGAQSFLEQMDQFGQTSGDKASEALQYIQGLQSDQQGQQEQPQSEPKPGEVATPIDVSPLVPDTSGIVPQDDSSNPSAKNGNGLNVKVAPGSISIEEKQ